MARRVGHQLQRERNFSDGHSASIQPDSVCVYGYQIPLNVNKTVKSVKLPNTRNIVMLSMDLTTPTYREHSSTLPRQVRSNQWGPIRYR